MRIPIGVWVESAVEWLKDNMSGLFTFIKIGLGQVIDFFEMIFTLLPFVVMLIIIVLLALRTAGIKAAIFALLGLLLVYFTDLWTPSMETLAMITTATLIALVIGIPLGILMAKSNHANKIIRPILDFMQTMPSFVYLIPAVYFFGLGTVPGTIATIIFAMPIVKLTDLGIRQVPKEVVEAASAFGATPFQKLAKVQLPLAMPTMLAGLNQTIMLSLSMVVISAMIGAEGLGKIVLKGIPQMKIGQGFEGGLAVVIVAMILDRITQCFGNMNKKSGSVFVKEYRKKKARRS